ncbi:hypothetical protein BJF85_08090 [Saccharomonospora sp. CUA-673]|uniref:DddA-like double-stranded DNA deaminase toxin n=1 Tax=Saccharomonospora sp. CUA-673 TaxID=1904969 RepID=UPI000962274A|nr:DddA-like double-stranded DNA deaminase toxin [Saccharomonospora sp. CUA-673]OLT38661.1 hypothetical protein BJF85_08090 [Saccharomonospora sp. CUA-673]
MSVEQLAAAIGCALGQLAAARSAIAQASQTMVEARETYAYCVDGTRDPDAGQAPAAASEAVEQTDAQHGRLTQIEHMLRGYLEQLGATTAPAPGASPARDAAPAGNGPPVAAASPQEQVERARAQLPPRVGSDSVRRKTHGRWWSSSGGEPAALTSGRDEAARRVDERFAQMDAPWPIAASADVEMKLAQYMADNNITEATVVINNRPCQGALSCDNLLSVLLPTGSSLTVYGTEPDGTPFKQTYRGGRKPPWQ